MVPPVQFITDPAVLLRVVLMLLLPEVLNSSVPRLSIAVVPPRAPETKSVEVRSRAALALRLAKSVIPPGALPPATVIAVLMLAVPPLSIRRLLPV